MTRENPKVGIPKTIKLFVVGQRCIYFYKSMVTEETLVRRNSKMNSSVVTPWILAENLVEKQEIGDFIEIRKCATMGIFYLIHIVGHLSNKKNESRILISCINLSSGSRCYERSASIQFSNFFNVCGDYQWIINNSMDKDCKPLPAGIIYYRVLNSVGECGYGDRI
uniref:NTR domain-containing protein n=1 Tax=Strongyloides venezuelensis TaxID=75913 RepID=A0A0K0EUY9_STRVS